MSDLSELRCGDRYIAVETLSGAFGATVVSIVDVAENGAQIEHAQPLRLGSTGRFVLRNRDVAVVAINAIAIWSRLSRTPDANGKYVYRSGLRLEEPLQEFASALGRLTTAGLLRPDDESLGRKQEAIEVKQAARTRTRLTHMRVLHPGHDIPDDQILLIEHTLTRLRANPEEAMRWYNRARFALNEDANKGMAESLRHREDVLAVWEYLERSIDVSTIVSVFERQK